MTINDKLSHNSWELQKLVACSFEQNPETAPYKRVYGHLSPITQTIQVRQARHAGHSWVSKDELISNVLWRTTSHGHTSIGLPAKTYIHQICADKRLTKCPRPKGMDGEGKSKESTLLACHDDNDDGSNFFQGLK